MDTNIKCLADGISELRKQLKANGEEEIFIIHMCQQYVNAWMNNIVLLGKK